MMTDRRVVRDARLREWEWEWGAGDGGKVEGGGEAEGRRRRRWKEVGAADGAAGCMHVVDGTADGGMYAVGGA